RGVSSKWACASGATYTCKLPAYALVGFRLDYAPGDQPWKVAVYGTNILNKTTELAHRFLRRVRHRPLHAGPAARVRRRGDPQLLTGIVTGLAAPVLRRTEAASWSGRRGCWLQLASKVCF